MKKPILIFLLILISVSSLYSEPPVSKLEIAYQDNSKQELIEFLDEWHKASSPSDVQKISDPVLKDVYEIYATVFQPFDIYYVEDKNRRKDDFYKDVEFVIAQNTMRYSVVDKLEDAQKIFRGDIKLDDSRRKLIQDFRPFVSFKGLESSRNIKVLYLDEQYEKILLDFLGTEEVPVGSRGIMSTSRAVGESAKRQQFLPPVLKIMHGHWGGWDLLTFPYVVDIFMNESRTEAVVFTKLFYQWSRLNIKKKDGVWQDLGGMIIAVE